MIGFHLFLHEADTSWDTVCYTVCPGHKGQLYLWQLLNHRGESFLNLFVSLLPLTSKRKGELNLSAHSPLQRVCKDKKYMWFLLL